MNEIIKGIAYGVGVGPGDPELMTLKALRIIRENEIIAVPGKDAEKSVAYQIALQNIPELAKKKLVPIYIPMVKDRELIHNEHKKGAQLIEKYLDLGKNVVYLTLGDPTIYCSFSYLQHIIEKDGYRTEIVSGVTSFCAAAARLNFPLTEWDEQLHILPAVHKTEEMLDRQGTYVLMKSASSMKTVKEIIKESNRKAVMVENCGMDGEMIFKSTDEIPDDAGYFSLVISKQE